MTRIDERLVDRRLAERNIQKGLLTRQEYEAYKTQLPDSEANAEILGAAIDDEPESELPPAAPTPEEAAFPAIDSQGSADSDPWT